jgi:hypothetical protein
VAVGEVWAKIADDACQVTHTGPSGGTFRCMHFARMAIGLGVLGSFLLLASCAAGPERSAAAAAESSLAGARLDQVQFIGSHNSFKQAPQPELLEMLRPFYSGADGIDYSHLSLTDQLNLGLRNLELDVYFDPEGGRYRDPMGERMLRQKNVEPWPRGDAAALLTPGFKVLHDADFDFRTCHIAFEGCLAELARWSDAHAGHTPIVLTMNTKQGGRVVPGAASPAEFTVDALKLLNATVIAGLGRERLLTPDDVRGNEATLREAVSARGWPSLAASAGRFIFVLDEGGTARDRYLASFPGLRGAAYFVNAEPEAAEAAIFVINDPVRDEARIRGLVTQGFLVRTRADADTKEARSNDFSRFDAAKRSGAQIITTDYYIPDRSVSERYMVRFDDGTFFRANPVTGR